jgi:hypothetical protein
MQKWLWLVLALGATVAIIAILWAFLRTDTDSVALSYPGGVELAGPIRGGRGVCPILQWVADPADPKPCPVVLHLPKGDLGGDALCDADGPAAAERLGGPAELDIFPLHKQGKVVGVRVSVLPGGSPVEVSVAGKRLSLPVSEEDVVRLLGDPSRRVEYDPTGRPRQEGK